MIKTGDHFKNDRFFKTHHDDPSEDYYPRAAQFETSVATSLTVWQEMEARLYVRQLRDQK